MDINSLPMELLQNIMSYLNYQSLKDISLVCHRWNDASEKFIVRNGSLHINNEAEAHLGDIRNCIREYQSICIHQLGWSSLQLIVSTCAERFPRIRRLRLLDCLHDFVYQIYIGFQGWMGQCESLLVSIADLFDDPFLGGPKDFEITLPGLKCLSWSQSSYVDNQKLVTINAPNMERIYINNSHSKFTLIRIPMSDRLKFIKCMFCARQFEDTFVGNISNVETLILKVAYDKSDAPFLKRMRNLRYLSLDLDHTERLLISLEEMHDCNQLKVLSIKMQVCEVVKGAIKLEKIFNNFQNLDTLELRDIDVSTTGQISAKCLTFLKLKNVNFLSSCFSLNLPQLKTLSVSWNTLCNLQLSDCGQLKELFLEMQRSLKQSFDHVANYFILNHNNLKKLVLHRGEYHDRIQDEGTYACNDLGLESLELYRTDININFFRMLSAWKSLRNLTIASCTINCEGASENNEIIVLPYVERMRLDKVRLRGTQRNNFPLRISKVVGIYCTSNSPNLQYYNTRPRLEKRSYQLNMFTADPIDPFK